MYSIGNLAEISHITVRTLRYYDEIGLLKPARIGKNGQRYYDDQAVAKLHNIMMLKEMGFKLEKIDDIIGNQVKSTKELLHIRLEIINEEKEQLIKMEKRIHEIMQLMELGGSNNWRTIFDTVTRLYKGPNDYRSLWSNYFTPEEVEKLNNLPKIGEDKAEVNKLVVLLNDIRKNINEAPSSNIAQDLGKRWMEFVHEIYNGNEALAQKAWTIGKKHDIGFYEFDSDIVRFVEAAISCTYQQKQAKVQQ